MTRGSRWAVCVLLCLSAAAHLHAQPEWQSAAQEIQAVIRKEKWPGWGGGEPLPADLKSVQPPEKFEKYERPAGEKPRFSGKITGLDNFAQVEVGIVFLGGTHWLKNDNYQWSKANADGTFEVVARKQPEAKTTLAVRAPKHAWNFLRAEFEPTESARNVELLVKPAKPVRVTMEDSQANPVRGFKIEIFNAYQIFDDAGTELHAQRFDAPLAKGTELSADLPLEPMGFLLSGPKVAPYYQVVDPRQADHFHFKMLDEARIKGLVTRKGQPVADVTVFMVNEAAPLSASRRKTDKQGRFDIPGRVPGSHDITVEQTRTTVELSEGETRELTIEIP